MKKNFSKKVAGLTAASALVFSAGCTNLPNNWKLHDVEFSNSSTNAKAFGGLSELAERMALLKKGEMTKDEVYTTLQVPAGRFAAVPDKDKMLIVDAGIIAQPLTVDEQIKMKARTDRYEVYELSYKKVQTRGGVSFSLASEMMTSGFDLRLQLTFLDGKFDKVSLPGTAEINLYSRDTIIETLISAVKSAFGGGVRGQVTKAVF